MFQDHGQCTIASGAPRIRERQVAFAGLQRRQLAAVATAVASAAAAFAAFSLWRLKRCQIGGIYNSVLNKTFTWFTVLKALGDKE